MIISNIIILACLIFFYYNIIKIVKVHSRILDNLIDQTNYMKDQLSEQIKLNEAFHEMLNIQKDWIVKQGEKIYELENK